MDTVKMLLTDIVPDPGNTRIHDERNIQVIMKSLAKFGQYRAFVVQKPSMVIRVGNGMYEAMKRLGWKEGYVIAKEMTDEEATALSIIDNRSSDLSYFDDTILRDIMQALGQDARLMTGFNEDEIKRYFVEEIDFQSLIDGVDVTGGDAMFEKKDFMSEDENRPFYWIQFDTPKHKESFYQFIVHCKKKYKKPAVCDNLMSFIDDLKISEVF